LINTKKPALPAFLFGLNFLESSPMSITLHVQAASKAFGAQTVLNEVSLELTANSVHGLIGLNGAGKTTLLKCILDLQRADVGEISIGGLLSTDPCAREDLVYLPERFMPPDYMQSRTYLDFIIDAYYSSSAQKRDARASIESLCQKMEFAGAALDKPVRSLSKGMTQKLGIIGCLVSGRSLLILDEPISGLDPKARALLKAVIQELKAAGKTILFCSHILEDVQALCDQVSILDNGRLLLTDKPAAVCRRYQTDNFETAFLRCLEENKIVGST
jgi:ABC-2 type transport system ATP-binding protein